MTKPTKRVLFVDDEPQLLEGLKCRLRPLRSEWDMSFANSAKEALAQVEKASFDVVVSDMHMPGLSGLELLAEVKTRNPNAVRIVLSGTADKSLVLHSVGVAHQFLAKPCGADELRSTVLRAFVLRELLSNERLLEVASRIDALPSLPSLYLEIQGLLESGRGSIEDVGGIIAKDVAMSAKVLHLANSAFFGASRNFTSPVEATVYLGLDTITALVLTRQVFSQVGSLKPELLERLWSHSLRTGAFARTILKLEKHDAKTSDLAFLAGLLHEVGLLVLAIGIPDELAHAWKHAKHFGLPMAEAERRVIGASRAAVGAYLMGIWGLPDPVVEAIAFCQSPTSLPHETVCPLTALHVAAAFESEQGSAFGDRALDNEYLERLGIGARVPVWRDECTAMAKDRRAA